MPAVSYRDRTNVTNRLARVRIVDPLIVDGLLDVLDPFVVHQISDEDLAILAGAPPVTPFTLVPSTLLLPDPLLLPGHGHTPSPNPPLPPLYPGSALYPTTTLYPANGS